MMGEDPDYEVHQSRSGHSQHIAPMQDLQVLCMIMRTLLWIICHHQSPCPDDDAEVYGLSNLCRSKKIADSDFDDEDDDDE